MKSKLIKTDKGYILEGDNLPNPRRLSFQNCQEIENGYDLDELAFQSSMSDEKEHSDIYRYLAKKYFKLGFQKALEILGDKKFSEEDMSTMMLKSAEWLDSSGEIDANTLLNNTIKSLQQTEWQVEVVYHRACNADNFNCGNEDKCQICTKVCPKLDAWGCIILKRTE